MYMNEGMFLSRTELGELTGLSRPSAQIRWLRANGFEVLQRADGVPLILRDALTTRMGFGDANHRCVVVKPCWNALDAKTTKV